MMAPTVSGEGGLSARVAHAANRQSAPPAKTEAVLRQNEQRVGDGVKPGSSLQTPGEPQLFYTI